MAQNTLNTVKQSMIDMTAAFNTRLEEFQQQLDTIKTPATASSSPSAKLGAEFEIFRTFVITSLKCLTTQVELLTNLYEKQEMRSRRKMLLVHGVPEESKEDAASTVVEIITKHLEVPPIDTNTISRCHRLGRPKKDKPRPILIKLTNIPLRDKIWFGKTGLKGSEYTLSEFLTKQKHSLFMAARTKFGISKCWTANGNIIVLAPDGSRRRISTQADIDDLSSAATTFITPVATTVDTQQQLELKKQSVAAQRVRRNMKLK